MDTENDEGLEHDVPIKFNMSSVSSAQFCVSVCCKTFILNNFLKARVNCIDIGFKQLPPCCLMEPKKFSIHFDLFFAYEDIENHNILIFSKVALYF